MEQTNHAPIKSTSMDKKGLGWRSHPNGTNKLRSIRLEFNKVGMDWNENGCLREWAWLWSHDIFRF